MSKKTSVLSALLLAGAVTLSAIPAGAQEVFFKARLGSTNYCHMKYPRIVESTLFSDNPVLKSVSEGDLIDFYGPCDHNPLGKDEIAKQREEHDSLFTDS